jgi:excisionase family DNA binding protein
MAGPTKAIRDGNRETMRRALNIPECAYRLNCAQQPVRRLIHRGDIRAFRIGEEFRVLPEDLDAYIESRMESA